MRTGGVVEEAYYGRGMLEIRSTLHLAVRIGVRVNQAVQQTAATPHQVALWHAALPFFVVLDIVVWLQLRRTDRFGLAWRLPLDALDAAFWVTSPLPASGHYDWAALIAIPLGIEGGVRLGWRGLVIPGTLLVSMSVAATLAGKPLGLLGILWICLAVVMGIAFFRYCRLLDGRAEAQRQNVRGAARRRAYLAGQNQVAMGASSAVDAIEGLVPVLGRPKPGSALWQLADGWKSELSASTAREAEYLQVTLLEWERVHNSHPDLDGLVRVRVDEGQGTTLLTVTQARHLHAALDRIDLRGPMAIRLRDADATRLPGQALRLDVGGRALTVPPDRRAIPHTLDPCAVSYLYVAVLTMATYSPNLGGVPLPAVVAGVAVCAGVGVVSHRRIVTRGERARTGAFALAVAAATLLTLLGSTASSPLGAEGEAIFASGTATLLLAFLGGFYWRSLAGLRWLMPAAVALNIALGVLLYPDRSLITVPALVASVLYGLFPYFPCRHLAGSLERARDRHAELVRTGDEEAEHLAFLDGRESVVGLVRQARIDALRQLELVEPDLDAGVARLAADRLKEVERRLRTTQAAPESSSSTTIA